MKNPTTNQTSQTSRSTPSRTHRQTILVVAGLAVAGVALGACSSSSPKPSAGTAPVSASPAPAATDTTPAVADTTPVAAGTATSKAPAAAASAGGAVLPVPSSPIANTATAQTLKIDSVLVENNLDATGKATSDHLEVALSNTGTTALTGVEVFYTFTDPTTATTENYYTKLPADFSIPAGGKRIVHFDDTGAPDHFPVNKFSLYYTSKNAMDVSVTVSAKDAAVQKLDLKKDAGGAEAAD